MSMLIKNYVVTVRRNGAVTSETVKAYTAADAITQVSVGSDTEVVSIDPVVKVSDESKANTKNLLNESSGS